MGWTHSRLFFISFAPLYEKTTGLEEVRMQGGQRRSVVGVVMAGGDGERLWPVSTRESPKQFQDVLGLGETLLQGAVRRLESVCAAERIVIVTSERHVSLASRQATRVLRECVLGEPSKRNTAPCIALAVALTLRTAPDAVMVIVPSDHFIADDLAFKSDMERAVTYAADHDSLVTIGIQPSRAAVEYGYIEVGEEVGAGLHGVERFREKPDVATAEAFLCGGNFLWNSGMFVWRVAAIAAAFRKYLPGLLERMEGLPFGASRVEFSAALEGVYAGIDSQSIDYGVMERAGNVVVLPASFKWSDVGTWSALLGVLPRDSQGNSLRGAVQMSDCEDTVAWIEEGCEARLEGLRGGVVALRDGRLLVRGVAPSAPGKEGGAGRGERELKE